MLLRPKSFVGLTLGLDEQHKTLAFAHLVVQYTEEVLSVRKKKKNALQQKQIQNAHLSTHAVTYIRCEHTTDYPNKLE